MPLAASAPRSAGAYAGLGTSLAYRVSKAAQNMATICLAAELGPHVRFVALHPGELATSMGRPGARTDPAGAARMLVALVERGDLPSPAFVRVDGERIAW